jgi:hypothetical protein
MSTSDTISISSENDNSVEESVSIGIEEETSDLESGDVDAEEEKGEEDWLDWDYHSRSVRLNSEWIQRSLDEKFSRTAQIVVAVSVHKELGTWRSMPYLITTAKLEVKKRRPIGSKWVHWKDALKLFLVQIATGLNYDKLSSSAGIAKSTLYNVISWVRKLVPF